MIGMESMNVEGTTEENVNNLYNLISKLSFFQKIGNEKGITVHEILFSRYT